MTVRDHVFFLFQINLKIFSKSIEINFKWVIIESSKVGRNYDWKDNKTNFQSN